MRSGAPQRSLPRVPRIDGDTEHVAADIARYRADERAARVRIFGGIIVQSVGDVPMIVELVEGHADGNAGESKGHWIWIGQLERVGRDRTLVGHEHVLRRVRTHAAWVSERHA